MHDYRYKYGDKPLEGYTIQRAAGRGGFGEVYYAISDSGRQVALKTVQNHEHIELRGIKQCMNLKSPHLVSIFDVKYNAEGRPFVIMEFVSGVSLRDLLNESPGGLGTQKSAYFLREIAKGLSHLHECGIVHRDLKPSNIFYENGYAKIGDYGLTKAIANSCCSEQTVTVGTVHYMAPEIGEGKYDLSIDIYALGILLYEMLTGEVPFFGASPSEVLMKHLSQAPDLSGIDPTFARVIKKALAKDPKDRYQTVQEMVEDVFGTEHIRHSVSQFSPESLSMVADHVAKKAQAAQAKEEKAYTGPPNPKAQAHENLSSLGENIGRRIGEVGDRLAERIAQAGSGTKSKSPQQIQDSIGRAQRNILGMITIVMMAVGIGFLTRDDYGVAAFLMICGTIAGISLMRWHFIKDAEPGKWRNWFAGGLGIFLGVVVSGGLFRMQAHGLILPAVALCFVDWWKITRPNRKERVAWGNTIGLGMLGFFMATIFGGDPIVSAGVIVGTIIGIQIISPFGPAVAAAVPTGRQGNGHRSLHKEWQTRWQTFVDRRKERSQTPRPVQPSPSMQVPASPMGVTGKRKVPSWLRGLFMLAMIVTLGIWIFAFIASTTMHLGPDEQALAMSFGFGGLVSFIFCLCWSCKKTFKSWYRFLVKPAVQLLLLIVIIAALCAAINLNLSGDEEAIALFFFIFPAVLFLIVSFIPSRVVEDLTGLTPMEDLSASKRASALSPKSRLAALLLCLLPLTCAVCGIQRFYAGKIKSGILWLLTGGLFGIGQLIDFILILSGGFRDARGQLILDWNPGPRSMSPPPVPNSPKDSPVPVSPGSPPPSPIPVPGPQPDVAPEPATTPPLYGSSASVWQAVEAWNPVGRLLAGLGFVLLFVATIIGLFVALHIPWFVSGGFPNPEIATELQNFFGFAEWPNMVETIGCVVCALIGVLSLALIIIGRRKDGAFHIIRAIIGVSAVVIALMLFAEMIPTYYFKDTLYTLPDHMAAQRDEFRKMLSDQQVGRAVGFLLEHIYRDMAILGGSLMAVSVATLAWPAKRGKRQIYSIQTQPA
ncbi:MAG: protein kinase [Phycisphaerae bacterium]|nr:protein kinase [Phycisphaerae bacterium]